MSLTKYENKQGDTSEHRVVEVPLMISLVMTDTGDRERLENLLREFCRENIGSGHLYKRATYWEWVNE